MTTETPTPAWSVPKIDEPRVQELVARTGLSSTAARILVARSITGVDEVADFLKPSLSRHWLDPRAIPGMAEAAARVAAAVTAGERILVFGDFDLDGVSAAALTTHGLEALGATVSAFVPRRFDEGYGLSRAAIERASRWSPDLVLTVDCGVSAAEEVQALLGSGIDVVITDHHEPGEGVPVGVPVANPKLRADGASRDLAGAGVALKLIQSVGGLLGQPDVWRDFTDLATLGTVADIVPLVGENRALVADGLRAMREHPRLGIAALCAVAGVSAATLTSETIAFALSPRLNAAGRMADPKHALDLLLAQTAGEAEGLARSLDEFNRQRQTVEADLTAAALNLAQRTFTPGDRAVVLAGEGWHDGVKGIVASRIAQSYRVPTILFSVENGVARGSGRSFGSVDLFAAVEAASGRLERFGGHEAAVGLSLPAAELEPFRSDLLAALDEVPAERFIAPLAVDCEIELGDVCVELGAEIALLEPFGHGNPRPVFVSRGVFMNGRERVGKTGSHFKFTAYDGSASLPAILFRCDEIDDLLSHDAAVDVAFNLDVDEWRGRRRAQLHVRQIDRRAGGERGEVAEFISELFDRADQILSREDYAGIEDAPSFHTKLAGVSFEGRQELVAALSPGSALRLVRQPDNRFDPNAIAVLDPSGEQVGFLNRRLASVLAPAIDGGVGYDIEVTEVTGGDDGKALGVNIVVSRRDLIEDADDLAEQRASARERFEAMPAGELVPALREQFIGTAALHDAQTEALEHLEHGESTLVVMATGRGKSLIFHLHAARLALQHGKASVFVFPLRALVADQAYHLERAFADVGLGVAVITGESTPAQRDSAFAQLADGGLDVVLTTPEFLDFHASRFAATGRVGFVVVDEAHHVGLSRAGHRPSYARLDSAMAILGGPCVLAVTATASTEVARQIIGTLSIDRVVLDPTVRTNLAIEDARGTADKDTYLSSLVAKGGKSVVYVNSRDATVRIARMLRKRVPGLGYKTAFYNGGLTRPVRHAVESAFRSGEVQVVVATSAFGEGVNVGDIRNVVLYHLPFGEVEFNQMAGRCGRDGLTSRVHLVFGEKDASINERILSSLVPERDDLAALYRVLRGLAETEGEAFEITNAELAERCKAIRRECALDDRGVSSALGIFRDLGLVTSDGHGAYRRLTLVPDALKTELTESVRYAEGQDEVAEFADFKSWALSGSADDLLERFNRPILPDLSQM
jgi:single-stranded-DNA-specific exonuclease